MIRKPSLFLTIVIWFAQQEFPHIRIALCDLLLVALTLLNDAERDEIDQLQGCSRDASAEDEILRVLLVYSCSTGGISAHHVLAQRPERETFVAIVEVNALVPTRPGPQIRGMWLRVVPRFSIYQSHGPGCYTGDEGQGSDPDGERATSLCLSRCQQKKSP